MSSPCVIDSAELLSPISDDNPCGVSLRWEAIYDKIKSERTVEEDILGSEGAADEINWGEVYRLTTGALGSESKDLMIAAWLTESLVALHGFAGARDGLRLIHGLMENYWEGVFPLPDDGDLEPRVAPLVWLMDADRGARLPNRLREVKLFPDSEHALSWLFWKSRYTPPRRDDEGDEAYASRKSEAEQRERLFEDAASSASLEYVLTVYEDIQEAKAALGDFDTLITERFGDLAPGVTAFRQALEECEVLVRRIARDKGGLAEASEGSEEDAADEAGGGEDGRPTAAAGPIASREDAFRRLAEVAAYLRRAEPQSPVPHLIDRAISWGRMPFDQLLHEIIKDEGTQRQVQDLLGIRSTEDRDS